MFGLQTFDADRDGLLNKDEYCNFLRSIKHWDKGTRFDETEWSILGCTVQSGVTAGGFCRLYQNYRHGRLIQDTADMVNDVVVGAPMKIVSPTSVLRDCTVVELGSRVPTAVMTNDEGAPVVRDRKSVV